MHGRASATEGAPPGAPGFVPRAVAVGAYGVAMACLEAAVVMYLQLALAISPTTLFPLRDPAPLGGLGSVELGRELATLVMLAAVGWLAGQGPLERLAWSAVAFGAWDIGYYGWLRLFSGWPTSPGSWDLLFLVPVPWVGPVWAPVAVSAALIGCGLAAARHLRAGRSLSVTRANIAAGVTGGALVVLSFTWDAGRIVEGGTPDGFPWPLFVAGMALAGWGTANALRSPSTHRALRARAVRRGAGGL